MKRKTKKQKEQEEQEREQQRKEEEAKKKAEEERRFPTPTVPGLVKCAAFNEKDWYYIKNKSKRTRLLE